jgi:hypothetical protein
MNTTENMVKVSSARPADWAMQKAKAMHAALANACDKAIGRERERLEAELERLAHAIQRREERRTQREAWKQARKAG